MDHGPHLRLILVGSLVRASGAGLGCPDWPRCFGSWIPPASAAALPPQFDASQFNPALMWTEYLNRLLGVTVGFFILAATISAWRHHRRDPHILWPTVAALLLTGYEGWLGGRVVAHELAPWIVTAHLVVAIVIVLLLLYATVYAIYRRPAVALATTWWRGADDERAARLAPTLVAIVAATMLVPSRRSRSARRFAARSTTRSMPVWRGRRRWPRSARRFRASHRGAGGDVAGARLAAGLWAKHPRDRRLAQWTYAAVAWRRHRSGSACCSPTWR